MRTTDRWPDTAILTPAQAARLLGCSVRTVYGLCQRPDFPVVRLNARCYRIPAWRLRQWLDAQAGRDGLPAAESRRVVPVVPFEGR
jgi:excisionase family DNA binding protein